MSTTVIIIFSVVAGFILLTVYNYYKLKNIPLAADNEAIVTLTDANFQHQIKNKVVLVDFWASWCAPCRMQAPILNEVASELTNDSLKIGKINIEHFQSIAKQYNVRNIPTLILFKNGKEMKRYVGIKQKDFLMKEIKSI